MRFALLALSAWATLAPVAAQGNICTTGTIGQLMAAREHPCTHLYCAKTLYPTTWKTELPTWESDLAACSFYDQVEPVVTQQLGSDRNNACKCARGLLPACPDLMIRNQDYSKCICKPGTITNGKNSCRTCTAPMIANKDQTACVCPDTMEMVRGACRTKCPATQVRNTSTGRCGCVAGRTLIDNKCYCSKPTVEDGKGNCVRSPTCTLPKTLSKDGLSCDCPSTMLANKNTCICKMGSFDDGKGGCKTCFGLQNLNSDMSACDCPYPYILDDLATEGCRCPDGMEKDGAWCRCTGQGINDGTGGCKTCPSGKQPAQDRLSCVCSNDTVDDGKGGCMPCGYARKLDEASRTCICSDPFFDFGGRCRCIGSNFYDDGKGDCAYCPPDRQVNEDQTQCTCIFGLKEDGVTCKGLFDK